MARWCARYGAPCACGTRARQPPQRRRCRALPQAQLFSGELGADALRRCAAGAEEPGSGAERCAHRAAARRAPSRAASRCKASSSCSRARSPTGGRARLRAEGRRHHRHQRQDHHHRADRAADRARRPARRIGRQHRADDARHAAPTRSTMDDAAGGVGARAVELPARRRASGFEPDAAAVLNITQDHLDWHGTMQAYAAAKARVFGNARDDGAQPRRPRSSTAMVPAEPRAPSRKGQARKRSQPRARSCASASTRRSARATSASSSRTAWPGWCAR